MSLADYADWNEDAKYVWWMEEGRHDPYESDWEDPYDD